MKHKNRMYIPLLIVLLIFVFQACGPGKEDIVESTQIDASSDESSTQNESESNIDTTEACEDQYNESKLDPSQFKKGNLEFEGLMRDYLVFLPKDYTEDKKFPLVVYLHCYGWTAEMGMKHTMMNHVANNNDFLVVYPSGELNWNSGIGENSSYPTPDIDDVGFINNLLDTLINDYSIDPERIYATGYSNGGFMAYKLACQLNHRFAAIAPIAGVLSTNTEADCNPLNPMPVLHIHGTKDAYIAIDGMTGMLSVDQTLEYWKDINNCTDMTISELSDIDTSDNSTVEMISYTNCINNSDIVYYKVIDGGHTWPCAVNPGYGNKNQDFNASVTIWNFFKDHSLGSIKSE